MNRLFESRHHALASLSVFYWRMAGSVMLGLVLTVISLLIGMCGYHFTETMSWTDSFLNASMILSGMGPVTELKTMSGKIFAGSYALFSGLTFIMIVGLTFSPLVHRLMHKFHIDEKDL